MKFKTVLTSLLAEWDFEANIQKKMEKANLLSAYYNLPYFRLISIKMEKLDDFPTELLLKIFQYLSLKSIKSCLAVSRYCNF